MSNMYKYRLNSFYYLIEAIPGKALIFRHYTLFIFTATFITNYTLRLFIFCLLAVFFIENYINAQQFVQKSF